MPETKKKGGLVAKLSKIQAEVGYMEKGGRNSAQGYKYLSESQIAEKFKDLLVKHGVFFLYESTIERIDPSPSGKQLVTSVEVHYTFYDVESGEALHGTAAGQGSDATDKGVYKAVTGAVKYIFMKTFLIPTGDDPEDDSKDGGKSRAKKPYPPRPDEIPFGDEEED